MDHKVIQESILTSRRRVRFLDFLIVLILIGFGLRLFQVQILRHDYYQTLATAGQERVFTVASRRGTISLRDGLNIVPVVINEKRPTLFADATVIEDVSATAGELASVIDSDFDDLKDLLSSDRSYVVLKKQLTLDESNKIRELGLAGVGLADASYRVYPEGSLAAQTLGFVNDAGEGQYGIEEGLNTEVGGTPGSRKVVTDVNGVPLTTSNEAVDLAPVSGQDVVLTIDRSVQAYVEKVLADRVKETKAKSASAIVIDPRNGSIIAVANSPTYQPADFRSIGVDEYANFQNAAVGRQYETGSGMKVFTMAAGLEEGVVTIDSEYLDSGEVVVGDRVISNAGDGGTQTRDMKNVIEKSVNTGVVHVLSQLGGGEINEDARKTLHRYFDEKFGFGQTTNVEIANETPGTLPSPSEGDGLDVRYANMTFGQGMSVSMLQMVAAFSSIINGGDRFQPTIVANIDGEPSQPVLEASNVLSESTRDQLLEMTKAVVDSGGGQSAKRIGYNIGGKTGTAQVLEDDGTYSDELEIGSFIGYGGASSPEYVIMTRVDEPQIDGYAGSAAAAPLFAEISNYLIDYYQIPPVEGE